MVRPLVFPQTAPSAMIEPRQSTTVPKVSNTSAFTPRGWDLRGRAAMTATKPAEAVRRTCLRLSGKDAVYQRAASGCNVAAIRLACRARSRFEGIFEYPYP